MTGVQTCALPICEYAFTNLDFPPSQVLSVLQFRTLGGPVLPNLKSLELRPTEDTLSFIPVFLSPTTTAIDLILGGFSHPTAVIASMVTTFPTLCPNLQEIRLNSLPRDPMITAAISELLLATNRDALRSFHADSPLTEDAREVVFKLPDLRELRVVINEADSLPTLVLPSLTEIDIEYDRDCGWLQGFRGATLGKLASVTFRSESHSIDGFLEAFESVALTTSIPATLSNFTFYTSHSWRPNYRSLLPFTQLKELVVDFSCGPDCSSTIDDDIIIDLAQAMPMLEILHLGEQPCQTPGGITAKGLAALAHYCLRLSELRIHFQVASLNPPEIPAVISNCESTTPWVDCALTTLEVGDIRVPKKASLMVTLTLVRIFPRLSVIYWRDEGWEKVEDALSHSKQFVSWSSERYSLAAPRSNVDDTSPRNHT